jgi:hypothetical protein
MATFVLVFSLNEVGMPRLMRAGSGHQMRYLARTFQDHRDRRMTLLVRTPRSPNARFRGTQSWPDGSVASQTMP